MTLKDEIALADRTWFVPTPSNGCNSDDNRMSCIASSFLTEPGVERDNE